MKIVLLSVALAACAFGQVSQPVRFVTADPAGACTNGTAMRYNYMNGKFWGCDSAVWTQVSGGASGLTIGTTTITSGTTTRVLFDNAGVLGEYTISGSGNVAMTTSPTFTTPSLGTPSAVVLTNATGLPLHAMANLGTTTTILHGNAAGDPSFGAVGLTTDVTGILPSANGGTGVNNTATLTLGSANQNWGTLGTGIVKNTTTTGALSNAASADVVGLFTGCSGTLYLGADGACHAASGSGTVTSIATTSPITGGTITTTGTIACATCVVASSPGAGIAHFAGSTQTVTSSAVSLTADVTGVLPSANSQPHTIGFTIDGGGVVLTAGQKLLGQLGNIGSSGCVITGWSLTADQSGSISIDLDAHSSSAPNVAPSVPNTTTDKISASAPMVLSTAQTASGGATQVSTWTTARAAWDTFAINVTGTPTSVTRVTGTVWCQ